MQLVAARPGTPYNRELGRAVCRAHTIQSARSVCTARVKRTRRYGLRLRHKVRKGKEGECHLATKGSREVLSNRRAANPSRFRPHCCHLTHCRVEPVRQQNPESLLLRARLPHACMRLSSRPCTLTNRLPKAPLNSRGKLHRLRRVQP